MNDEIIKRINSLEGKEGLAHHVSEFNDLLEILYNIDDDKWLSGLVFNDNDISIEFDTKENIEEYLNMWKNFHPYAMNKTLRYFWAKNSDIPFEWAFHMSSEEEKIKKLINQILFVSGYCELFPKKEHRYTYVLFYSIGENGLDYMDEVLNFFDLNVYQIELIDMIYQEYWEEYRIIGY